MKINQITLNEDNDPCWDGYKRVPGTKKFSSGSCEKVEENFNGEYDDEAGMADNNIETMKRAVDGLDGLIHAGDNLPEWCQEKIAVAKSMLVTVWDYMASEEQNMSEGENWSKHNNPRAGGMSKKSVKSYRRSHPGSKIQTAVTTKPSKLKKGSKSAKRRASFCARMRGMKKHRTGAKTARDPNSNINKSLRRWNCESIEDMQQLIMIAEQQINEAKNLKQQAAIAISKKNEVSEESKGLWANIHAKRERIKNGSGERMRKPGSKGAPTADALKKSANEGRGDYVPPKEADYGYEYQEMVKRVGKKAKEQELAKKKQQEKPKDLGESNNELNNILKLSGHIK